MTLVLENRQQLAAPQRLDAMPPGRLLPTIERVMETLVEDAPPERALRLATPALPPSPVLQSRALVERNPRSSTALARLAQAELVADHLDDAQRSARAALEQTYKYPDAAAALAAAVVLISCGESAEAEQALARLGPESSGLVLFAGLAAERGDFDSAEERLRSEDSVDACNLRGWIALQRQDFAQAIHYFRRATRESGPTPASLTNLGLAHAALGQRRRAIKETRQALALAPSRRTRVGINLAWYYLFGGDIPEALNVLRGLQRTAPTDVEPVFAEARVQLSVGDRDGALRILRRARTRLWAHMTPVQQAELIANLAFVQWHRKEISAQEVIALVTTELRRVDYASLRIANMLPPLTRRFSDLERFSSVLAHVGRAHYGDPLYSLEVHHSLLERRFEDAMQAAVRWAEDTIFDAEAATTCTSLLCDVGGQYEAAAELGKAALDRMPSAFLLRNNVAYALALSGRAAEAREYLDPSIGNAPHIATDGLVALRSGDIEQAQACYQGAMRVASEHGDDDLAALVLLHAHVAFTQFAPAAQPIGSMSDIELSEGWRDDVRFAVALHMLERLDIDPPPGFPT